MVGSLSEPRQTRAQECGEAGDVHPEAEKHKTVIVLWVGPEFEQEAGDDDTGAQGEIMCQQPSRRSADPPTNDEPEGRDDEEQVRREEAKQVLVAMKVVVRRCGPEKGKDRSAHPSDDGPCEKAYPRKPRPDPG